MKGVSSQRSVLCLFLAVCVMASVIFAPSLVQAKQPSKSTAQEESQALESSYFLKVDAPSTVIQNEQFTIKVFQASKGNEDDDKALIPVAGAEIYILSRFGPLAEKGKRPDPAAVIEADESLLGITDAQGSLTVSVKDAGKYVLKATKEVPPATGESESIILTGFTNILVSKKETGVVFTAGKHIYTRGEAVHLYVYNRTDQSITLTSAAPWTIGRPNGSQVFAPFAAQVLVEIKPGESKEWTWDQKAHDGGQVKPGIYLAVLKTTDGQYLTKFNIAGLRFEKGKANPEPTFPQSSPFKDVTGAIGWGDPHILRLRERNIVKGRTSDTFDPDATLTRAEFLALLLRATGADPEMEDAQNTNQGSTQGTEGSTQSPIASQPLPFPDVTPEHWAYRYIERAREMGIIKDEEYPNGFGPDVPINRLEICVMAVRAMGVEGDAGLEGGQQLAFQDREQVELRYRGYVKAAVDWDIIRGFDDNTFRPNEKATRRQACVIVYRILPEGE